MAAGEVAKKFFAIINSAIIITVESQKSVIRTGGSP